MAEIKPGDRPCCFSCGECGLPVQVDEDQCCATCGMDAELVTYAGMREIIDARVQAAWDSVARQAFAALCYDCRCGYPAKLRESDDTWVHPVGTNTFVCAASIPRLAIDPDGRLAGAQVAKGETR